MNYSLKKVLALLLAAVIAISVFNASPAANVEAKSTKYKAGAVYVTPYSLNRNDPNEIWKSVNKIRATVYNVNSMCVYKSDLAAIVDVKVKGKGLAAAASSYVDRTGDCRIGYVDFEAKKAGTYTVSFKIRTTSGAITKKYSFKVFATISGETYKSVKFGGQTIFSSSAKLKKGVRTIKNSNNYKISKKSGRLYVKPNSGYKITGLVVVTSNGKNGAPVAKSYKNGANIQTSSKYSYKYSSAGSSSRSVEKYTAIYISYKDTKMGTYVKYSVTKKHGTQEIKRVSKYADGSVYTSYIYPSTGGGNFTLWNF